MTSILQSMQYSQAIFNMMNAFNNGYLLYTLLEIHTWLLFGILPYLVFQSMDYSRSADWWYPGSDVSAHCKLSRCLSFLQGILVGTCTWTVQQHILPHQDSGIFKKQVQIRFMYQITEYSYNYGQGKSLQASLKRSNMPQAYVNLPWSVKERQRSLLFAEAEPHWFDLSVGKRGYFYARKEDYKHRRNHSAPIEANCYSWNHFKKLLINTAWRGKARFQSILFS